jgi:hypothetical protein
MLTVETSPNFVVEVFLAQQYSESQGVVKRSQGYEEI